MDLREVCEEKRGKDTQEKMKKTIDGLDEQAREKAMSAKTQDELLDILDAEGIQPDADILSGIAGGIEIRCPMYAMPCDMYVNTPGRR